MTPAIPIRPAVAADLDAARSWLAAAGLPSEDLTAAHMADFLVALGEQRAVGMIGIEQFAAVGLLRSLVVDPHCRNAGLGRQLVDALEKIAADRGITELWLLTIDAEQYFVGCGYETRPRADAPAAIQETPEFASLCPGDAVLMRKHL